MSYSQAKSGALEPKLVECQRCGKVECFCEELVTIQVKAELVEDRHGSTAFRIINGFGDPEVRFAPDAFEVIK